MSLLFPPRPEDFKFAEAKSPRLRISTYSDAVRLITIRGLTRTGLIHDTYYTTSSRTLQQRIIPLTEIPLTVLVETSFVALQRGQLFVLVSLELSGVPVTVLAADYLTMQQPVSWPNNQIRSSTDGPGAILPILISNPVAGANFFYSIPNNTLFKIHNIHFSLTTSATVATRNCCISLIDNNNYIFNFGYPSATQIASLYRRYIFTDFSVVPPPFTNIICGHLPKTYFLTGSDIECNIENYQIDDQITEITFLVEQWLIA